MTTMMTKAERAELRSVVRQRFKVLRSQVEQRQVELTAEINAGVTDRFATRDHDRAAVMDRLQEVIRAAERECTDLLVAHGEDCGVSIARPYRLRAAVPEWSSSDRHDLVTQALADLKAKVHAAKLRLDEQEADLLQQLAIDALETDAARQFLSAIPTVGQLVPAAALPSLDDGQ